MLHNVKKKKINEIYRDMGEYMTNHDFVMLFWHLGTLFFKSFVSM